MSDTEILVYLIQYGCIDWPQLSYLQLVGADQDTYDVRRRLFEMRDELEAMDAT